MRWLTCIVTNYPLSRKIPESGKILKLGITLIVHYLTSFYILQNISLFPSADPQNGNNHIKVR